MISRLKTISDHAEAIMWIGLIFSTALLFIEYTYFYIFSDVGRLISTPAFDAFYVFEIGANIANGHGYTFDQIHKTNGSMPLWTLLVSAVFIPVTDRVLAIRTIGILSTVLFLSAFIIIRGHLRKYEYPTNLLAIPIVAIGLFYLTDNFIQYNLESSLVIPLGLLGLTLLDRYDIFNFESASSKPLIFIGTVFGLLQLARLDAVILNLILFVYVMYENRGFLTNLNYAVLAKGLQLFGPIFATGAMYIIYNYVTFARVLPVTAVVKSSKAFETSGLNYSIITSQFLKLDGGFQFASVLAVVSRSGLLLLSILFIFNIVLKRSHTKRSKIGFIVSVFFLMQVIFYIGFSNSTMRRWYFYPLFFVLVFVVPEVINGLLIRVEKSTLSTKYLEIIPIVMITLLIIFTSTVLPTTPSLEESTDNVAYRHYQSAQYVSENFDKESIFAMGDLADSFSYFADQRVVHLEGLVNNYEIVPYIEKGEFLKYMNYKSIDYFVIHGNYSHISSPTNAPVTSPLLGKNTSLSIRIVSLMRITV